MSPEGLLGDDILVLDIAQQPDISFFLQREEPL
jgi:hypothetical protein